MINIKGNERKLPIFELFVVYVKKKEINLRRYANIYIYFSHQI